MDFTTAVKTCFSQYFVFKGRARRSEFWWFYLFTIIGGIPFAILDLIIVGALDNIDFEIFGTLFSLATFIPSISAGARRLHDTDRSGWWQLMPLIALIALMVPTFGMMSVSGSGSTGMGLAMGVGGIALLITIVLLIIWLATDGHKQDNRFGSSPKHGSIEDTFI